MLQPIVFHQPHLHRGRKRGQKQVLPLLHPPYHFDPLRRGSFQGPAAGQATLADPGHQFGRIPGRPNGRSLVRRRYRGEGLQPVRLPSVGQRRILLPAAGRAVGAEAVKIPAPAELLEATKVAEVSRGADVRDQAAQVTSHWIGPGRWQHQLHHCGPGRRQAGTKGVNPLGSEACCWRSRGPQLRDGRLLLPLPPNVMCAVVAATSAHKQDGSRPTAEALHGS
mmetsp:Transcript_41454/g.109047  ORF Transcript_41454/g.109047 Transcript_41454/m.109047 type:complete len:223 (-) Transcript_41454:21-689(-)